MCLLVAFTACGGQVPSVENAETELPSRADSTQTSPNDNKEIGEWNLGAESEITMGAQQEGGNE